MALLRKGEKSRTTPSGRGIDRPIGRDGRAAALGLMLVTEPALLLAVLVPLLASADAGGAERVDVTYLGWTASTAWPALTFLVSLVGGAVGGTLHGVASLTAHVAAEDFDRRWTLWYLANPLVGAALAGVFLFVLQAGLGGQTAPSTSTGIYGVAAVATLTGLFSRHALAKLRDVFDVAFASRQTDAGTATAPVLGPPTILGLAPTPLPALGQEAPLAVSGTGFTPGSEVYLNGARLDPASLTSESISVLVPGSLLGQPGTLRLRVRSADGLWSNEADLEVQP